MNVKEKKGITLIALVITIIILLILASISLNLVFGEYSIIEMAKRAVQNTDLAKVEEENELKELEELIEDETNENPFCIVTFDSNGGTELQPIKVSRNGGTYENLPTPTKSGYAFNGWYTSESEENGTGTKVENGTEIISRRNHTLYANWRKLTYQTVIVIQTKENGQHDASLDITYNGKTENYMYSWFYNYPTNFLGYIQIEYHRSVAYNYTVKILKDCKVNGGSYVAGDSFSWHYSNVRTYTITALK